MLRMIYGSKNGNGPTIYMGISEKIIRVIEYASRICYDSTDKMTNSSWNTYISARVKSGHESVIEHGMISAVIDFTCDETASFSDNNEIQLIESILAKSNSLLHYISETGWNPTAMDKNIIAISGNLKMWRDLFKWIYKNIPISIPKTLKKIINMFVYFDYTSCDGIFTSDIPQLYFNNQTVKNKMYLLDDEENGDVVFVENIVKNWDDIEPLSKKMFMPVYIHNSVSERDSASDNDSYDEGVAWGIISSDNFGISFLGSIGFNVSKYMLVFFQTHVLDLNSITLYVKTPRIISQQECRHRINSISQRSQRYVNESKNDTNFYVPGYVDKDKEYDVDLGDKGVIKISYEDFNKLSVCMYQNLINDHIKKEDARFVLPNSIYTEMVLTKPLYTLPHYFKERCSDAAQSEMRLPARALRNELNLMYRFGTANCTTMF